MLRALLCGRSATAGLRSPVGEKDFQSPRDPIAIMLALLAGSLVALVHAVVTVSATANQVVSGVAINLIAWV